MVTQLKRMLIGQPLESARLTHERLPRVTALAVFSSDALSSVAYATEAILGVLILAGSAALGVAIPIAAGITVLLVVVAFSYRQTIHAYPNGGGAYIVARENLGDNAGLIAAAALLIDYVLTVAVSISAGVAQLASIAIAYGFGWLADYRVPLALTLIALITLANLRGVKESGIIFAIPTYAFVICFFIMIAAGILQLSTGQAHAVTGVPVHGPATQAFGLWLVLRAFAAGCTALTGVEAISDGVPAFKRPESRNAAATLTWMVTILGLMFLGITVLARSYGALPIDHGETVVSQVARSIFGTSPLYVLLLGATAMILVLAANTAYADFPRLASFLARDRFLPHKFSDRGDRLVFSNGIVALGICAGILVWIFHAEEQWMLPLYAIGVFVGFTLSQGAMVRHWLRQRGEGWRRSLAINTLGACMTLTVLSVILLTRFTAGGWAVVLCIPLLVMGFHAIRTHYHHVAQQLSLKHAPRPIEVRRHTAVVLVSGVHKGVIPALQYARSIAPDNASAVFVDIDSDSTSMIHQKWEQWGDGVPLVVLPSPYRSLITPLLRYLDEVDARYNDDILTVIIPEFVPAKWWQHLLHNQTGIILKAVLTFRRGMIVTSVPYRLER